MNNFLFQLKILLLILVFYPFPLRDLKFFSEFIVWNVGQGQWTTWVNENSCVHFDMGGEHIPWNSLFRKCENKWNILNFTHKDMDHTGGAYKFYTKLQKNVCLKTPITVPPYPENFKEIPKCEEFSEIQSRNLIPQIGQLDPPMQLHPKNANFHSHVYLVKNILIPGDSTKNAEKFWAPQLPLKNHFSKLILGHHGSKTSTSPLLLSRLRSLNQCVSSARKAKYGHPSRETLELLRQKKCPHLNTEKWGHIHFLKF